MISVLMSVYNEDPAQLTAALTSIENQTDRDWELVVVLDNPDATTLRNILQAHAAADARISLIENAVNSGLAFSLNRALAAAQGGLIARMDADDVALPDRFATSRHLLTDGALDVLSTNADFIDENDAPAGTHAALPEAPADVAGLLPLGSFLIHPSILMKTTVVRAVGGYRLLPTAEDYDLWLRLLQAGARIGATNQKLLHYRIRSNSMTQGDRYKMFLATEYLQRTFAAGMFPDATTEVTELTNYLQQHGVTDAAKRTAFNAGMAKLSASKHLLGKKKLISGVLNLIGAFSNGAVRRYFKQTRAYQAAYNAIIARQH